jgi:UDP-N-acetylmuramyl pentapeptide phosphotransferase/UDP-N-acetylglucosamine-1-phosphate transferase
MPFWIVPMLAALVAAAATATWERHARRRQLLDAPERRRLHDLPTPRGGGIGPVLAALLVLVLAPIFTPALATDANWTSTIGLLSVATVSLVDDHRPLSVRLRLGVHLLAGALLALGFVLAMPWSPAAKLLIGPLVAIAAAASMNLHNFMDGSDAHLASQALFVFVTLALLAHVHDAVDLAMFMASMAAAVAAFLPFNWPRARVFLGDVGSISLGFLIAAASLTAIRNGVIGWGGALLLSSGFVVDASATLAGRLRRTRHWTSPHRDHLYQWLRRRNWGAARVVASYQGWNLLVVAPAIALFDRFQLAPAGEFAVAAAVYALGLCVWCAARGALRRAHRAQYRP